MTNNFFSKSIKIETEDSVHDAVELSLLLSGEIGFSPLDINMISCAVSESCTNVIKYGIKGNIEFIVDVNNRCREIICSDHGPGIKQLGKYMSDGNSSAKASLGVGLGVISRSMNSLSINTGPEIGTTLKMIKWRSYIDDYFEFGHYKRKRPHEVILPMFQELTPQMALIGVFCKSDNYSLDPKNDTLCFDVNINTTDEARLIDSQIDAELTNKARDFDYGLLKINGDHLSFFSNKKLKLTVLHKSSDHYQLLKELGDKEELSFSSINQPIYVIHDTASSLNFAIEDLDVYDAQTVAEFLGGLINSETKLNSNVFLIKPTNAYKTNRFRQ